ncbi:MAG: hypothetical protein K8U57_21420, partial [Planctomycetes bacterium]|nr:hypothetical protein [Planctomycetota bacterium]
MQSSLITAIAFLTLILIIISLLKGRPTVCCDEEEETITTTTTQAQPNYVGALKRQVEGNQFFVLDPVDQQKTWLNSNDDSYEDADGKIWR